MNFLSPGFDFISFFDDNSLKILGMPFFHLFIECFLIILVAIVWKKGRVYPKESRLQLSSEEEDLLIQEWTPAPLVAEDFESTTPYSKYSECRVEGKLTRTINFNDNLCLNFATSNFLNFIGDEVLEKKALACISKYSVGTCGPRGFYGTTDIHLKLEKALASFCGSEHCIIYSFGFSTFSSAICSYCKKQDIIFADEGVSLPIQIGILASRSKVFWFKHNDVGDLEKHLETVRTQELADKKKYRNIRKYIIIEGVYQNYGDIPDVKKIIQLKYTYKARILVEESFSMGVIGESGRGIVEHFGLDSSDIDLRAFSFENAFASCGGACVGSTYVIDHQRLSGSGYCFSASSPTFLCQVVLDELEMINNSDKVSNLQKKCKLFKTELSKILNERLVINGSEHGPIFHIRFDESNKSTPSSNKQEEIFNSINDMCIEKNVLFLIPSYLTKKEHICPKPSIRVSINCSFTDSEILNTVDILGDSINHVLISSF